MRAAAARQWEAARRPRSVLQDGPRSGGPAFALAPPRAYVARGTSLSLVLLAAAMIAFAVIGLAVTQSNDRRLSSEQHAALTTALDELHAVFGDVGRFDGGLLRLIEQRSGLKDLRFGADPKADSGREIQSLQDSRGRIIGWFSWAPNRTLIRAMDWLWALAGAAGIALICCALISERATRRLARALRSSIETTRRLVSEDVLTGLPNQRMMLQALDRALARGAGKAAFALLDVDGLREVNDTSGRAGGDAVLRAIAERLRAALPEGALLGRFEDDEFAAVASDDVSGDILAEALRACFSEPFAGSEASAGQSWRLSAGIGFAQAPEDGVGAEQLSRSAALALRAAKRDGHGTVRRFAAQIEREESDRRFLLRELKAALAAQAFELHYQPIVAASGGAVIGVEALLRWTHPARGAIAPSAFIPLAEEYGVMQELGEFALRRALEDAARWPDLFVAINLSPVQIRDPHFVDLVVGVMAQTGIAASRVVMEMTEGILIDDPQQIRGRLESLRALGVGLALDDFGTGYSSLSYLQKFPFQRLKIDRAFVASLGAAGNAGAIIHSIVTLGHALGMTVLGEGVETDQQRVLLRLAGCDEMQGYLFARPLPAAAIDRLAGRAASGRGHERAAAS